MDLLQYLIAPFERRQQPLNPPNTPVVVPPQSNQVHAPQTAFAHNLKRSESVALNTAPHSMVLQQRPSFDHTPAPSFANQGFSGNVAQNGGVDREQSQGGAQQHSVPALDQGRMIQALSAHPDIFAALLKHGYLNAASNSASHGVGSVSSGNSSTSHDLRNTPVSVSRIEPVQAAAIPTGPKPRTLCFWWYHFGNCNRNPHDPNFNGSPNPCQSLHYLHAGMDDVKLQSIPQQWHKGLGDCRLDRCRFSSTYRDTASQRQVVMRPVPFQQIKDVSSSTKQVAIVNSASTRGSTAMTNSPAKHNKQARKKAKAAPTTSSIPATPPSLKRKVSVLEETLTSNTSSQTKSQSKSKKRKKSANAPPPRYFDTLVASSPESLKGTVETDKKQTCFFWYHDCCDKSGKKCDRMHALTNPPTFVQPPPHYVHREGCYRTWCPGDWMWDHTGKGGEEEKGKEESDEDNGEDQEGDGVELNYQDGEAVDDVDEEWYVQGFPDA